MGQVPDLLTIEEAARVLRIGRTKAYAMGQEYRATDGASGLPVVEIGGGLRVPRVELEARFGVRLTWIPHTSGRVDSVQAPSPSPSRPRRRSRDRRQSSQQPGLPFGTA